MGRVTGEQDAVVGEVAQGKRASAVEAVPFEGPRQVVLQPVQMLGDPRPDRVLAGFDLGVLGGVELVVDAPDVPGCLCMMIVEPGLLGGSNHTMRSAGSSDSQWMSAMT